MSRPPELVTLDDLKNKVMQNMIEKKITADWNTFEVMMSIDASTHKFVKTFKRNWATMNHWKNVYKREKESEK